jgi:16S rRNA (adenine1518-N6/adenine1519-N6)-dimethyltransferase
VLEIGGGLGVLSEHLATRAGHVHVVEVDRALVPALRDALDAHANTSLHVADAMASTSRARARPDRVVANLPYGIAASAILRTIEELPGVERWVAMVQKEVGERLAAAPGTAAYGVPSVLAQLACEVRVHRADRADGLPPGAQRRLRPRRAAPHRAGARAAGARVVQAAFAHRRKALARSLALAPGARARGPDGGPRRARAARPSRRRARRAPRADGARRAGGGRGTAARGRAMTRRCARRAREAQPLLDPRTGAPE